MLIWCYYSRMAAVSVRVRNGGLSQPSIVFTWLAGQLVVSAHPARLLHGLLHIVHILLLSHTTTAS